MRAATGGQVAGTEMGVTEPEATFSACFGGAFLMWHPMKYAAMLADKMETHGTTAWLVNTGCALQRGPPCLCLCAKPGPPNARAKSRAQQVLHLARDRRSELKLCLVWSGVAALV